MIADFWNSASGWLMAVVAGLGLVGTISALMLLIAYFRLEHHTRRIEDESEKLQDEVVKRFGYQLLSHTHKLYGLCRKCQATSRRRRRKPPQLHVEEIVT